MNLFEAISDFLSVPIQLIQFLTTLFFTIYLTQVDLQPAIQQQHTSPLFIQISIRAVIGTLILLSIITMLQIIKRSMTEIPQQVQPQVERPSNFFVNQPLKMESLRQQNFNSVGFQPTYGLLGQESQIKYRGSTKYTPQMVSYHERKQSLPQKPRVEEEEELEIPISKPIGQRVPAIQGLLKWFMEENHFRSQSQERMIMQQQKSQQQAPVRNEYQTVQTIGADTKSIYSMTHSKMTMTNHGQIQSGDNFKKDYYKTQIQNEEDKKLQSYFHETESGIKRIFKVSLKDLEKRTKLWLVEIFVPFFLNEYKECLNQLNGIMKSYFDRKINEVDIFYSENPNDVNTNWNESGLRKKETTLEQINAFYHSYRFTNSSSWKINNIEKFQSEEKEKLFQLCLEMDLYNRILHVVTDQRSFAEKKNEVLSRLVQIAQSKKVEYYSDSVPASRPSDMEILSCLFMNCLNLCAEFETSSRKVRLANSKQLKDDCHDFLSYLKIGLITREMFRTTQLSDDHDRGYRAYFIQQISKANPLKEPHFHFYSELFDISIPTRKQSLTDEQEDKIIFTPPDENGLFYTLSLYFLHVVKIPKAKMSKIMSHTYHQKLLSSIVDFANELSYTVSL